MRKNIKPFLFSGVVGLSVLSALRLVRRYSHWTTEQLQRLQSESRLLKTARGPVEIQIVGSGPDFLFSHGTPAGYDQAMALARLLGLSDYTLLAPSRPGYLRTPLTSGETPEEQADLYAAALDGLGISQAVIVGHSGGGPLALQFALRHPERCRGLVLLSAVSQPYSEETMYRALPPGLRQFKQVLDRLTAYNPFVYLLLTFSRLLPSTTPMRDMLLSLSMPHLRQIGYQNDLKQFSALPAYPVHDINVPTLIIHGTADLDVPYSSAVQVANALPHAHLLTIKHADHISTLARPEKMILPALRAFLAELETDHVGAESRRRDAHID